MDQSSFIWVPSGRVELPHPSFEAIVLNSLSEEDPSPRVELGSRPSQGLVVSIGPRGVLSIGRNQTYVMSVCHISYHWTMILGTWYGTRTHILSRVRRPLEPLSYPGKFTTEFHSAQNNLWYCSLNSLTDYEIRITMVTLKSNYQLTYF